MLKAIIRASSVARVVTWKGFLYWAWTSLRSMGRAGWR